MSPTIMAEGIVWALVAVVAYVYVGYPALLWTLTRLKREPETPLAQDFQPTVSLIVAAHNEESGIDRKLTNCLALDYPRDKLDIIVVSDGSVDRTADIARQYADRGVRLVALRHNAGKSAAQNAGVRLSYGDLLVFTDADVWLQPTAVRRIVEGFRDRRVGCVTGRVVYSNENRTGVFEGESAYWQYELLLRSWESRLGLLAMASGALIAVRRNLFSALDAAVSEDFMLPMHSALAGYQTIYAADLLVVTSLTQDQPKDMLRTRSRTITLDTRSVFQCRALLNPFRRPLYSWSLVSHKILRWLVPAFLIVIFVLCATLWSQWVYRSMWLLQAGFYALAAAGAVRPETGPSPRLLSIPFSFCLVNLAALVGLVRFLVGRRAGRWVPVR